jgi:DNA-binding IclR family transcriptional regulator
MSHRSVRQNAAVPVSAMKRMGFVEWSERTRVESVERALLILKCFDEEEEALSLATLAQRTELYKSTILRLSASLRYMGFLRRRSDGWFVLGPEAQRLGVLALRQPRTDLETLIRPALRRLVKATHETASFFIREGNQRICLFRENSPRPIRHHLEEGTRHPLHRGAAGQILRAYGTPSRDSGGNSAQKQGWIISRGKRDPDLAGVAVPVFNSRRQFVGALSVSGLLSRFSPAACEKAKRALLREAHQLPDQIIS